MIFYLQIDRCMDFFYISSAFGVLANLVYSLQVCEYLWGLVFSTGSNPDPGLYFAVLWESDQAGPG